MVGPSPQEAAGRLWNGRLHYGNVSKCTLFYYKQIKHRPQCLFDRQGAPPTESFAIIIKPDGKRDTQDDGKTSQYRICRAYSKGIVQVLSKQGECKCKQRSKELIASGDVRVRFVIMYSGVLTNAAAMVLAAYGKASTR